MGSDSIEIADTKNQSSLTLLKILIITRNLPPLVGGMERLNWHMAQELAKHAEVRVIGPSGAAADAPIGVTVQQAPLRPLWRFLISAQWQAIKQARNWRPHVVLAGSGLTAPLAYLVAKTCGAQSVVYVHGLDLVVEHAVYKTLWLPCIRRMHRVIANSRATVELAQDAGVAANRIGIVNPGVSLPNEAPNPDAARRFRSEHNLGERPVLLSVGRLTRRKGLREFVSQVLPLIVQQNPQVLLVIIGDAAFDALHAESQTPQSIQAAADAAGVGRNIQFLGVITDRDVLAAAYQSANIHVFPVHQIPGDPEGFGMVAVEAAANGLPTVAYATGGVVDAVANGTASFAQAVLKLLQQPLAASGIHAHATRFAWPQFGENLLRQINDSTGARHDAV